MKCCGMVCHASYTITNRMSGARVQEVLGSVFNGTGIANCVLGSAGDVPKSVVYTCMNIHKLQV